MSEQNLLEGLNEAQKQAVDHGSGPLLIVAGAGTGKTTVLTRRYAHLLESKGMKTENILALTFTEKAAGEMEDRVLQLLPNGTYDFWISTFHGFCQRILEEKGLEIGLPNQFKLLTETDGWLLLKRRLEELPLDHYRPLGNPVKFLGALLSHFSKMKDENISPREYEQFALDAVLDGDSEFIESERKRLNELAGMASYYQKMLRDEGSLDFGDLIQETLRLLRERPAVLKELRSRFKYILVDEFQDTNWAQYELVRLLAGDEKNLTVVGDDDQAIYKFRGASLANILQFKDDYPEAKTVYLTNNYRSKQEILDLAYTFIKQNDPNRLEVKLASDGLSKQLIAHRENGGEIGIKWYRSLEEEAQGVADKIKALKEIDPELSWNDIAILVRSNAGAEAFVHALDRQNIPFRFYALRGLYTKPVILDVISILRAIVHHQEGPAMWRILNIPVLEIAQKDIAEILFYANAQKGIGLWRACTEIETIQAVSEDGKTKVRALMGVLQSLAETAMRERPIKMLQLVLEKMGLLKDVLSLPEREKIESIEYLNSFASRIKRYEANTLAPNLKDFLDELQLEIDSGEEGALKVNPDDGPELVKILTIHASKGLEFKHVFLVSMVDQRFPTRRRPDPIPLPDGLVKERLEEGDAHIEEERRLFYVAVTRAKDTITLTGADDYGGTRQKKPSPFLAEAGLAVTDAHRVTGSAVANLEREKAQAKKTTENIKELYPLKRRFSYTQLAAFKSCPLQYKYAHIYKIPILGAYQKSFGQSVHLAFDLILKLHMERAGSQQGDLFGAASPSTEAPTFRVSREEAEDIYRESWIDEWYESREQHDEYFEEGLHAVRAFIKECEENIPNVKATELPFDWRIGQHSIKGKIDRIDHLPDGSIAIYDYKTGKAKDAEVLTSDDKEQLRIYQIAMEEKGERVSRLALVYVRGMVKAEVDLLEGEKKIDFKEKLQDRMNAILESDYDPNPSPFVCRYCDFRDVCEFRKL